MPKASGYPPEVITAARARRMRPDDYVRQTAECEAAEGRLAEINRKKLDEMRAEEERVNY